MEYKDFLKASKKCPFCNLNEEEVIFKNEGGIVFLARAPQYKNHLIIAPNKHVSMISQLNPDELKDLFELVIFSQKIITKFHENFTITYKEGPGSGKTINHLHINIIPELPVYANGGSSINRKVYEKNEYLEQVKIFKEEVENL